MGGLTVLHECLVTLPHEDFVYLGDGARLPYGPRPLDEIRRFAGEIAGYLERQGVKLVVAACNSATAAALPGAPAQPLGPRARRARPGGARGRARHAQPAGSGCSRPRRPSRAGGTRSSSARSTPVSEVVSVACPRLVPLIEGDDPFGEETTEAVREYAAPLKQAGVDTVILGCTHYPLIRPILQRVFGRGVTLVFSAEETAREVAETLERKGIENAEAREGTYRFLTTGDTALFREMGRRFLQLPIDAAEHVEVAALESAAACMTRHDGRRPDELRPLEVDPDYLEQPHGSVLYGQGKTIVLCTATVEEGVPRWLYKSGRGWMTAEYAMLPASTGERTQRAVSRGRPDGRTVEIQRLVGRALRSVCDFEALGERTLWLDCDVLQADGGTRCASITGAWIAASRALEKFGLSKALRGSVAAVSVGIVAGEPVLDLDYEEDSSAETDMNVVMTGAGELVEVQATAEREPFSRELLDALLDLAAGGVETLTAAQGEAAAAPRP